MTQQELNNKKIFEEAKEAVLRQHTRRHFLKESAMGLGALALGSILGSCGRSSSKQLSTILYDPANPLAPRPPMFPGKAKSVIYLHMAGAPSQLELFDYKPQLTKLDGQECPPSLMEGKKFAFIRGKASLLAPQATFAQHGESGLWISNYLPHFSTIADDVAIIKSMTTDQFNHAPAQLFMHTGSPRLGRPAIGAWVTYGLGTENQNLPGYVVLTSGGNDPDAGKSAWGSGFLPSVYQGVQCRSEGDPVLFINDPEGMDRDLRRASIDAINKINQHQHEEYKDPETLSRISQYEMAFRMQTSVPELTDISSESESTLEMYGPDVKKPGSFAYNCLLARRMAQSKNLVERLLLFMTLGDDRCVAATYVLGQPALIRRSTRSS